jgi:cytochrome c oxidase assembly protein subunit 15
MHRQSVPSPWPHRLAIVTAGTTVLLILVGGLVTNTGSGLAVPDWPTTFGYNMFTYPWSRMVGGIFYEHSHRLIGSLVGMLTVAFAASLWWSEPRAWVRRLGLVAVLAVVMQGVLGGIRVVLLDHGLAIVHGCVAQVFFALMVSLSLVTSRGWHAAAEAHTRLDAAGTLRRLALGIVPLVYAQLVFGALVTHNGARLDVHLLLAALVAVAAATLAGRVLREDEAPAWLQRPAVLLLGLLVIQLSLGIGAALWRFTSVNAAIEPSSGLALLAAHRVTGALLWGTVVTLALRIVRIADVSGLRMVRAGAAPPLEVDNGRRVLA